MSAVRENRRGASGFIKIRLAFDRSTCYCKYIRLNLLFIPLDDDLCSDSPENPL